LMDCHVPAITGRNYTDVWHRRNRGFKRITDD
jgi:hypothetical protein